LGKAGTKEMNPKLVFSKMKPLLLVPVVIKFEGELDCVCISW